MAFVVELIAAARHGSATLPPTIFIDRRCGVTRLCTDTIRRTFTRAAALVAAAPGANVRAKLTAVGNTGLHMLEHGNRLIFGHVADAAQQYLTWREGKVGCTGRMPSADVVTQFKLRPLPHRVAGVPASTSQTSPVKANALFRDLGSQLVNANNDLRSILRRHKCVDIMVVAFAAWEKGAELMRASGTRTTGENWIKGGNNLMAYCEQAEAVAPAFRPDASGGAHTKKSVGDGRTPGVLPGEVNRETLMELLTPFVKIGINGRSWTLDDFGKSHSTTWTLSKNWGKFSDRYIPILHGAFETAYRYHPRSLWPLVTR